MAPFYAVAELKQTAQPKNLTSNYKYESGPIKSSNRFTTSYLIPLIVKTTTVVANFDYVSPPPFLHFLKNTNNSL